MEASQLPGGAKGGWGQVSLSCVCEGGRGASQLPGVRRNAALELRVLLSSAFFCGEWRRVSFRGCEGGTGVSQLWSCVCCCRLHSFAGNGGESASGGVKGEWG